MKVRSVTVTAFKPDEVRFQLNHNTKPNPNQPNLTNRLNPPVTRRCVVCYGTAYKFDAVKF